MKIGPADNRTIYIRALRRDDYGTAVSNAGWYIGRCMEIKGQARAERRRRGLPSVTSLLWQGDENRFGHIFRFPARKGSLRRKNAAPPGPETKKPETTPPASFPRELREKTGRESPSPSVLVLEDAVLGFVFLHQLEENGAEQEDGDQVRDGHERVAGVGEQPHHVELREDADRDGDAVHDAEGNLRLVAEK